MIIIADSGSTKTDWKLVDNKEVKASYKTVGFNPYILASDDVLKVLNSSELLTVKDKITEVHLYAAGCARATNQEILKKPLGQFFSNAAINVNHDLLAAARATCGKEKGMVAILGTGSNSCLYDGENIVENITSLGYVLGDYGGGVDIGKAFVKKVLGKEFNKSLQAKFELFVLVDEVLDSVYKKEMPNRYLASFNKIVAEHISEKEIEELVIQRLNLFFQKNICKYSNYKSYPLHIIGSVGLVYKGLINDIANSYGITLGSVIQKPIDNLVFYHL